jgi:hypothetical protein
MNYELPRVRAVETVIDDNCGITKFYAIAHALSEELHVVFLNQEDDGETVDWDFHYKKTPLTLHFDVYGGVSLIQSEENKAAAQALQELTTWLHRHAF